MTNTKHTPGPWILDSLNRSIVHDNPARFVISAYSVLTRNEFHDGKRIVTEEMEANARLIASAPDLLAIVEGLMDAGYLDDTGGLHDQARAVVAKAKGEQT